MAAPDINEEQGSAVPIVGLIEGCCVLGIHGNGVRRRVLDRRVELERLREMKSAYTRSWKPAS
jgi:hypothetical protein